VQKVKEIRLEGRQTSIVKRIVQYCMWMIGTGTASHHKLINLL